MTERGRRLQRLVHHVQHLRDREMARAEALHRQDRELEARERALLHWSCDDSLVYTLLVASATRHTGILARERATLTAMRDAARLEAQRHARLAKVAEDRLAQVTQETAHLLQRRELEALCERPSLQPGTSP